MQILIPGAGLAGLSAGLSLSRQNHTVLVFESREGLSPTKGGINVRPAATRIMNTWGLEKDLKEIGEPTRAFVSRNLETGDVAARTVLVDGSREEDWGTTRDRLVEVLLESAREAGAKVVFGVVVVRVWEEGRKAFVELAGGRVFEGDLVIAADGIRSRVRGQILGDLEGSVEPIVSDITLYGVRVEGEEIEKRGDMKRFMEDKDYVVTWIGRDAFVISRYNETLAHARGLFGIRGQTDQKGLWDEEGDIDFVRKAFANSCGDLRAMLDAATSCDRWRLAELPDLPRWTSKNGRIILLGDSAHGMHPNAAHGFSLTVEDVGVLEYLITRAGSQAAADMPSITAQWQSLRKPRVERIKAWAKENTAVFIGRPPQGRVLRASGEGRKTSLRNVKGDMHAPFDSREFLKWTLDFDAVAEAKKAVETSVKANL